MSIAHQPLVSSLAFGRRGFSIHVLSEGLEQVSWKVVIPSSPSKGAPPLLYRRKDPERHRREHGSEKKFSPLGNLGWTQGLSIFLHILGQKRFPSQARVTGNGPFSSPPLSAQGSNKGTGLARTSQALTGQYRAARWKPG